MNILEWLLGWMLSDGIAEVVPQAHGGHPVKCHHYKHRCKCAQCTQMMAECNRKACRQRAAKRLSKRKGHGQA